MSNNSFFHTQRADANTRRVSIDSNTEIGVAKVNPIIIVFLGSPLCVQLRICVSNITGYLESPVQTICMCVCPVHVWQSLCNPKRSK